MVQQESGGYQNRKHVGSFLTASVALALYILIFEVITTSRNMALAFNIPNQYVGIYFDKVFALSNSFTTIGSIIDIAIYYIVKAPGVGDQDKADKARKGMSVFFLFLMFICRIFFVIILYKSRSMSYHFYILFSIEAFFFGFAQISYFAFAGEFSPANTLAINCSALLAFLVQTILDWIMPSNPLKMLRIHSFICFGLTLLSLATWPFFLFGFETHFPKAQKEEKKPKEKKTECHAGVSSALLGVASGVLSQSSNGDSSMLLYIDELSIIKRIAGELKDICSCCTNINLSISIRSFISRLEGISCLQQIDYELLVAIELMIVGIKRSEPSTNCILLKQLVLFLRIRIQMSVSSRTLTQTTSFGLAHSHLLTVSCTGHQVEEEQQESQVPEEQTHCNNHFGNSMSRFLLFHIPSFFKDFLFPGVLPFGLLDMNNCKLAIKLVPIFTVLGSLTNFVWSTYDDARDKEWTNKKYYDYIWLLIIPMIFVYIFSLLAIHSNKRFFRAIVNSQWRVIIMMLPLLYFYAFMENVSYSGVAGYVFSCSSPPKYVLESHNLTCMIFRYLFGKLAVGYSNVRIKSGYVLPNFKPVPGLDDTFCYWFCNVFLQAMKDIGKDFRLSIREYL